LFVLQGLAQIGRLLGPHGLSMAEAAGLIRLSEDMGGSSLEAFDQSLTALLRGLVRYPGSTMHSCSQYGVDMRHV
jgi:hypothetical protein